MSDSDQRRHPRIPVQQNVWVEGQDVRVSAQTRNISKGGMFVVSKGQAPAIGTTLQITFEDPEEGKVAVNMEVVWREESSVVSLGLKAVDSHGMEAFQRVVGRHEAEGTSTRSERKSKPRSVPDE
jgi:c-di-GMP-binding flagellar brake protein YcgR